MDRYINIGQKKERILESFSLLQITPERVLNVAQKKPFFYETMN